jgi:cytochrome P450/NADPH-cytochrome P450 reductase
MDPTARLEPIPRPPGHLLIGNLLDLDAGHPIESLMDLARQYGPIYELTIPSRGSRIIVSGTSWSTSCVTNPASISWWDQA